MRIGSAVALVMLLFVAGACGDDTARGDDAASGAPAVDKTVDFTSDVQPILAARCLKCHGADEPEAGLNLSDAAAAQSELDSGARAIVAGDVASSELFVRVTSSEASGLRMPPEGPPIAPEQIETLRQWISQGAPWPAHWAYRPLTKPAVPEVAPEFAGWGRNPIDSFIAARLAEKGLSPSAEAPKRVLLRRVSFDLIGMPPTPQELQTFLEDEAPGAYERAVERLLASPHYGERWARHWIDLVHFAETHGHDQDRPRDHAWPYRDYLVRALNADMPYAQFVREQVAGDALASNDPWAIVATGLLAAGPWDESSLRDIREDSLDRQIARYVDRDDIVTTVMSTFASTTVHCARCHHHKFDPISQADYYGLQAVFASTDKANRPYDADPEIAERRRELLAHKEAIPRRIEQGDPALLAPALLAEVKAWEQSIAEQAAAWQVMEVESFRSGGGADLKLLDDGSLLAGGARPDKEVTTITARSGLSRVTALRLETLTHESLPKQGPGRQDNGNLHLNEVNVWAVDAESGREQRLELVDPKADFNQDGWTIEMAIDGNPNTAWGVFPEVGQAHQAVFALKAPLVSNSPITLRVELSQIHGGGHVIGRARLSATDRESPGLLIEADLPPDVAAILALPDEQRNDDQRRALARYVLEQQIDRELAALPPQQLVYCGTNQFAADGSFRPANEPRSIHVLHRGNVTEPRDEALPAALDCLPGLSGALSAAERSDGAARRAALANWLTDERNVLAWRSIANRLWQHHFGRSLVDTPNDFGRMGSAPSHPELLDWLAVVLLENGGSLKTLHRLMVTSAAYRQACGDRPEAAAVDAENRLLWRMTRRRLDAEAIRDALLRLSTTLDASMGGPSVRQFNMSPGIHVTPVVDYQDFDVDDPANYRRSIYRFIFRTLPDPFMDALDCPDGTQLTPRRNQSLTALQALATLNDKFIIRQSQHLAERIERESDDPRRRIESLFLLALLRLPGAEEAQLVGQYAARHGLANACRMLINTNEFMFVE